MTNMTCILAGNLPNGTEIRIPLVGERLTVGRKDCDILLSHESVSRAHATLERRDGGWLVSDAGSKNGTTVNGVTVARQMLANGDAIGFGRVRLQYSVLAGDDNMPTGDMETQAMEDPGTRMFASSPAAPALVGRSVALQDATRLAVKAARARTEPLVLICGESGTGKELFARLVYDESPRREKKFVVVNCGAIEDTLEGDTLFGHVKGAFTGAVADKPGIFEQADGGTVFLDEIGEISPKLQTKLLRVLQEGTLIRLGGTKEIKVDVRVVCATNRDLLKAVEQGTFRQDLYYRLNVIKITLPPLRERKGDVEDLVRHFTNLFGGGLMSVSDEAMKALCAYGWPGNVRELRNTMERVVTLAESDVLQVSDLPDEICGHTPATATDPATATSLDPIDPLEPPDVVEKRRIQAALAKTNGNKKAAAALLEMSRSTFYAKSSQYGLG